MNAADMMYYLGQAGKVLGGNGGVKKGLVVVTGGAIAIGTAIGAGAKTLVDKRNKVKSKKAGK